MKKFLLLISLALIPILYLCTHNTSFRLTRQIAEMEEEKKLLTEQLEQNKIRLTKAFSYTVIEAKALAIGLTFPTPDSSNIKLINSTAPSEKVFKALANRDNKLKCSR
ncbi:MAG: hypothetical protein ABIK93_05420 [candidate division WOR-3 bacterium]